jgi:predicted O-linked N-acetylglucosamine transferase (SPINDLY family)
VRSLPALRAGRVTFGSFNRLSKIVEPVIASWSRLLAAVPGSRLLLKNGALEDGEARARLAGAFQAHGIAADRLELRGHSPHARMLDEYNDVDIALDPFPYNGGLTTCEALWMGVPVLCRLGDSLISRQSAALVCAAGLHEWIAHDDDEFVAIGRMFAQDLEHLAALRAGLRDRMRASPLTDGPGFARRFGEMLEAAWAARA